MNQPKYKIGDKVFWECRPYSKKRFIAEGRVESLYESTLGSILKMPVAKISVQGEYLKVYSNRHYTTVGIDKLFPSKEALIESLK